MIKEFVQAWELNKQNLETHLRTTKQKEYSNYVDLVKLVFDIIINPEMPKYRRFITDDITVLGDDDYQGDAVFILHENYADEISDYVYTHCYYGSCEVCDTLMGIRDYDDTVDCIPNDQQVEDYMTLCLHIVQRCKYMIDGERYKEE